MPQLSVMMRLQPAIDPFPMAELPRDVRQLVDMRVTCMDARNWVWDGENIKLFRTNKVRTIEEHIDALETFSSELCSRVLRADEMVQLIQYSKQWPEHWIREPGSRIFFAGTRYELDYPDRTYRQIYAVGYDRKAKEWSACCENIEDELLPGDTFACATDLELVAPPTIPLWTRSYARRDPQMHMYRPRSIRKRYDAYDDC